MKQKASFKQLFDAARKTIFYAVEGAILDFTEQVVSRMASLGINRSALAEKLDATPAYVTKLLKGNSNLTIESMVKVSTALDAELRVQLIPKTCPKVWAELLEKTEPARNSDLAVYRKTRHQFEIPAPEVAGISPISLNQENEILAVTA